MNNVKQMEMQTMTKQKARKMEGKGQALVPLELHRQVKYLAQYSGVLINDMYEKVVAAGLSAVMELQRKGVKYEGK